MWRRHCRGLALAEPSRETRRGQGRGAGSILSLGGGQLLLGKGCGSEGESSLGGASGGEAKVWAPGLNSRLGV